MKLGRFERYCDGVLAVALGVILWGAYVRASGSGAGCGSHWPTCNGEVIPHPKSVATLIEFGHRLSTGVLSVLVLGQLFWAFSAFPRFHPVRRAAIGSTVFLVSEALIGAGLVLFRLVEHDASVARALSVSAHLVNTFLLIGALALTRFYAARPVVALPATGDGRAGFAPRTKAPEARDRSIPLVLAFGLVGITVVGIAGAIAALGDTLFPAQSLAEGMTRDFTPAAHLFLRVRVWHPVAAVLVALYLLVASNLARSSGAPRSLAHTVSALVVAQIGAGLLNLALLAPIWMQLVHLLIADLLFIALVRLTAASLLMTPSENSPALAPSAR